MTLEEYLKPLIELHGVGYIRKYLGISYQALNKYYEKGFPLSEIVEPKKIRLLAKLAKKNKQTEHITIIELKGYINNSKGRAKKQLTQKKLKKHIEYNPETGEFFRKNYPTESESLPTGFLNPDGYVLITIGCFCYMAHRLAWLYMTGSWPKYQIDHINHKKSDNRFANLRDVTPRENQRNKPLIKNNTSGVNGVFFNKTANTWQAVITGDNRKTINLGYFDDIEEAAKARKKADKKYGYHNNHGKPKGD